MNVAVGPFAAPLHRLRPAMSLLVLAGMPWLAQAQSSIQITPLPEPKHATVTQLGAAELSAGDVQAWLDDAMAKTQRQTPYTGAVAVVVKDGDVVFSHGYGVADAATKTPVDPATSLFRVGAISSLFTWTAVMQLVEQHKLQLDVDINRYLDFAVPPYDGKPMTLRDLMTQTAGFETAVKDLHVRDAGALESNEAWLKRWVPARIYPAGEVPAYSAYGTALAGYIVQRVSGLPFDEYVEKHLFLPLNLLHATFRQPLPTPLQGDMARVTAAMPSIEWINAAPAGALSISGADMARFMIAHLQFGRAGDAQLLDQDTVRQMQGYQRAVIPGLPGTGLGLQRLDHNGQAMLGQRGDAGTFHSIVVLFPDRHTGLFVAFSGADERATLDTLVRSFADRYFPPLPQLRQPTLPSAAAHGAQLAGHYLSSRHPESNIYALHNLLAQSEITVNADGTLRAPMFDRWVGPAHWREIKPYLWLDDSSGHLLGALLQDGHVRMLSIDMLAPTQVYLPIGGWQLASRWMTLLYATLAAFALVALSWPLQALLRRLRPTLTALPDNAMRWQRLSCITALLYLVFAGGWCLMLPRMATGGSLLDLRLRLLQLVGVLAVLGTLAAARYGWTAWRLAGAWWHKLASAVLLLACVAAIVFIGAFHLLSPALHY
ncbi:serine hydrolase domain-containing protein [Dyella sp. ASV21]|uniref:serine hydrolase domain-containing protein n=1 Tax=Dyella sp. ASV21 TaxID=2795114 RepID=UPI0018EB50BA|nr:serine hydrolase domain-containing protein [Dyella sp. ASV21]